MNTKGHAYPMGMHKKLDFRNKISIIVIRNRLIGKINSLNPNNMTRG